mmetsp:Transcript_60290/g.187023  ORF Transcript_60290/g.187023 Transcript_60290/m.187023 type:complete len:209 (+) Transcript_60290:24-650(+)
MLAAWNDDQTTVVCWPIHHCLRNPRQHGPPFRCGTRFAQHLHSSTSMVPPAVLVSCFTLALTLPLLFAFVAASISFWKASAFSLLVPSRRCEDLRTSLLAAVCRLRNCTASRCLWNLSFRTVLILSTICIALTVFTMRLRLYRVGVRRFFSKLNVLSSVISLPWARRHALVHFNRRGLCFILKWLWHFLRQNRNILQSFRTNITPWPG